MVAVSELEARRIPDEYQYWDGQVWVRISVVADLKAHETMTSPTPFRFTRRVSKDWAQRFRA